MRIECNKIEDFIENLDTLDQESIDRDVVYYSTTRQVLDECRVVVTVQASTIINTKDGGQFHLEYGENCGTDYCGADLDPSASKYADKLYAKLKAFCSQASLALKPGIVHSD